MESAIERDEDGFIVLTPKHNGPYDLFLQAKEKEKELGRQVSIEEVMSKTMKKKIKKRKKMLMLSRDLASFQDTEDGSLDVNQYLQDVQEIRKNQEFDRDADQGYAYDPTDTKIGKIDVAELRPLRKKTHGHAKLKDPWRRMMDPGESRNALIEAAKHKMKHPEVQYIVNHCEPYLEKLRAQLENEEWEPPHHKRIAVNEGSDKKVRLITKPSWDSEQVVHHMVIRQFKQIVMPMISQNSIGSIPRRGTHYATQRMSKWVKGYQGQKLYVAELDIRKFYDNIDHEILKHMLRWYIKDQKFLRLLDKIIDSYTSDPTEKRWVGVPLGNYTSPWFANFYLIEMDDLIQQDLPGIDHYIRYMDNLYLFSKNKRRLHQAVRIIDLWLKMNRKLWIKDNWQVYRFEHVEPDPRNPNKKVVKGRAINSLGFVIHHNRVTVRKSILHRMMRLASEMAKTQNRDGYHFRYHQTASMVSRLGYPLNCDAHKYYHDHIRPKAPASKVRKHMGDVSREMVSLNEMYLGDLFKVFTVGYTVDEMIEKGILIRDTDPETANEYILNPELLEKGVDGII